MQCGLCLQCRFTHGDPFRPATKLLAWSMLKPGSTKPFEVPLVSAIDRRTGAPPVGHLIEIRCLRVDAPEWRYELVHSWPNGISLFVNDQRVLLKKPDTEHDDAPGPFELTRWATQAQQGQILIQPLRISAAITAKRVEQWAMGIVLVEPVPVSDNVLVERRVVNKFIGMDYDRRMQKDLDRVRWWVTAHRPDRVSKKDMLRCVEPPIIKLMDCTSLLRIETAARGLRCEHLQCFDLGAFLHTMRNIPPKHAWCCPICDKPVPYHQLRLDAFAQSVIDKSADNVIEVLVADNGKWEVSATEDPMDDDSSDDGIAIPKPLTQAELQAAALNLGQLQKKPPKPAPKPVEKPVEKPKGNREKSRSPRRGGKSEKNATKAKVEAAKTPAAEVVVDKLHVWKKLQGLTPSDEEKACGWLPEGFKCSKCDKSVVDKGGVYCGRKRPDGSIGGCHAGYCWKCMNKKIDEVGEIRTNKAEFSELGAGAWWMHEKCMTEEDKKTYYGEDDEDDSGNAKAADDSDDEHPGKFAWE